MAERPRPVLNDPRVVESWGGGWAPEQHTGTLIDGRRFYLRLRHGYAQLHVNTAEECERDAERSKKLQPMHWDGLRDGKAYPPCINPEFDMEEHEVAYRNGEHYDVPFWSDELAAEDVSEKDDGAYSTQEERDASFTRLLNRIEADRAARHDAGELGADGSQDGPQQG